jgi:protease-4
MIKQRIIVIVIIVAAVFSSAFLFRFPALPETLGNNIAVIYLEGQISEGSGQLTSSGSITPRYVKNRLEIAANDPKIAGVVLRINSPGGSVAASQEIADDIRNFSKPIVVSMGDTAASGGYYIASAADYIVAQPGTMTGSIGVIMSIVNLEGLYELLGIKVENITSGRHKDMLQRDLTSEEREKLQKLSDTAYLQFINDVAEGRGMEVSEVENLATGELFTGSQALELGLVDALGGLEEAVTIAGRLAGIVNPVYYELPAPSLFQWFYNLSYQTLQNLSKSRLPKELQALEMLEEGFWIDLRY